MLNKLRILLPDFTIKGASNLYDIRRVKEDGTLVHIPIIAFKSESAEEIARRIEQYWVEIDA